MLKAIFATLLFFATHSTACGQIATNTSGPKSFVAMNLAGHPDDEDGATMHYYRRAKGYEVHSIIFTRGEGGQNEIGPELYEALGAIRSEETEKAARQLGTQVRFLNYDDFGFSKSAEETFEWWGGREEVTATLVEIIRQLRPDVIFTNHDTVTVGPGRQHGHHQVVGIAAYDAFVLAADPAYRPSLGEPWQVKRLFWRHWGASENYDAVVPVGEIDPETGESYAAGAAHALHFHASQGMGQFAARVARREKSYFSLLRSVDVPPKGGDLFAGLEPSVRPAPDLTYLIDAGHIHPLEGLTVTDTLVVPVQTVEIEWLDPEVERIEITGATNTVLCETSISLTIPQDMRPTRPARVYQYDRYKTHPPLIYSAFAEGGEEPLYAGYLPIHVAPPVHLEAVLDVVRLRAGENHVAFRGYVSDGSLQTVDVAFSVIHQDATQSLFEGTLELEAAPIIESTLEIFLPNELQSGDYSITARSPNGNSIEIVGRAFDTEVTSELKVGIVTSYDDTLPIVLEALGVDFVLLDSTALATAAFEGLHTIVIDIRSYLVRSDLRQHNQKLLDWVRAGGHLVVNYHKTQEWNSGLAPLPLALGRDRVTLEDAPVHVQKPDHVLMQWPNIVGADAWDGWIQERGLYFPSSWDDRYETLFCMNDPGEDPHCGSTLIADVGEGTYLYTALGWYRQLKQKHPGAYAVFANMISLPLAIESAR